MAQPLAVSSATSLASCKIYLDRIRELEKIMDRARKELEKMVRELYGPKEALLRFGESVQVWEAVQAVEYDLAIGRLKLRDGLICSDRACVNLREFLHYVDDYYDAFGERQKMWRDLIECLERTV